MRLKNDKRNFNGFLLFHTCSKTGTKSAEISDKSLLSTGFSAPQVPLLLIHKNPGYQR